MLHHETIHGRAMQPELARQNLTWTRTQDLDAIAAADLLRRLPEITPGRVALLNEANGSIGSLLQNRFRAAEIKRFSPTSLIEFEGAANLQPFDLIFSCGSLEAASVLRNLAPQLRSLVGREGLVALPIHNDVHEPNRQLLRMVAADGPWAARLLPVAKSRPFSEPMESIDAILSSYFSSLAIWETTYLHQMHSVGAIVKSMERTSLAPYLAQLNAKMRELFLRRYIKELDTVYRPQPNGRLLFRFPCLFILAGFDVEA